MKGWTGRTTTTKIEKVDWTAPGGQFDSFTEYNNWAKENHTAAYLSGAAAAAIENWYQRQYIYAVQCMDEVPPASRPQVIRLECAYCGSRSNRDNIRGGRECCGCGHPA
jgi:hypothetical protein